MGGPERTVRPRESACVSLSALSTPLSPVSPFPFASLPHFSALPAGLDALFMPGVAFDTAKGARLGRGGGYYDAWVTKSASRVSGPGRAPLLVALAFRAQCVDGVPSGPDDVPVDAIATADGIVACSERGRAALGQRGGGGG